MTEGSKLILYLLFGILGLVLLLVLLSLGPLGWFLTAFLIIAVMAYSGRNDHANRPDRTNCAACGAPNPSAHETCKYCGASL
jgi:hypothetical protein